MARIRCAHCRSTHDSVEAVRQCAYEESMHEAEAQAEYEAERAAERFYEEGTPAQQMQYQWEVEMDERNAAFWGGRF